MDGKRVMGWLLWAISTGLCRGLSVGPTYRLKKTSSARVSFLTSAVATAAVAADTMLRRGRAAAASAVAAPLKRLQQATVDDGVLIGMIRLPQILEEADSATTARRCGVEAAGIEGPTATPRCGKALGGARWHVAVVIIGEFGPNHRVGVCGRSREPLTMVLERGSGASR